MHNAQFTMHNAQFLLLEVIKARLNALIFYFLPGVTVGS